MYKYLFVEGYIYQRKIILLTNYMNNKTALGVILGIVVVIAAVIFMMSRPVPNSELNENDNFNTTDQVDSDAQGRVIFSVTDAAADMGTVSEINMKVNSVEVHSEASGWATVSTTPRTYSLLDLNERSESELLAEVNMQAGTYDQIRLNVDSVAVITKAGATKIAKLPSGQLLINSKLIVKANETSSANFDFLADKSLHTTGSGEYIFAPVVKLETRSNTNVSVNSASVVSIDGGNVDDSVTIGMDIDGSIKANFQLKTTDKLKVGTDGKIEISL